MGHTGKQELCGEILNVPPCPRTRIEGSYGWNRTAGGLRRPDLPPLLALVELPSRLGRKGCGSCELVAINVAGVSESGGGYRFDQREGSGLKRMGGVFGCGNCAPGIVVEDRQG